MEIISQSESKPLVAEKDECARALNQFTAELETAIQRRLYYDDIFSEFYSNFRRLVTITSPIGGMTTAKYGKSNLVLTVDRYLSNKPKLHIDYGIRLARAYIQALITKGVLSLERR